MALRADEFQDLVRLVRRDDDDHADAHVEDLIQFARPARRPSPAMSWKIGSMSHEPLRMTTSQFFGSTRGMLSTKPPPVMWAKALTACGMRGLPAAD